MSKEEYRPQQTVQHEAKPQGGSERQILPSVFDILERRAQLYESPLRRRIAHEDSRLKENRAAYQELRAKNSQLGNELARQYVDGTDRDRLILDVYTTLAKSSSSDPVNWRFGLQAQETRQFIAKVGPMTEDELQDELHKAQEALERKTAMSLKMQRTRSLYETLTPEEQDMKRREAQREYAKRRSRERKEQAKLQATKPTQVFPSNE
jgi:hypothetical protein